MKKCLYYKIREARKQKELTIKQMADSLKIPASTLSMYERGDRNPKIETMFKIAKMFNVDMTYFYEGESEVDEVSLGLKNLQEDDVIEAARKRANGFCELCEVRAPFILDNGDPYLEVAYLKNKNSESVGCVLLCPNCNKKIELLKRAGEINYLLRKLEK